MAVLMTETLYCMLGPAGGARLLDILAGLYIFLMSSLWSCDMKKKKIIQNPVGFVVHRLAFPESWHATLISTLHRCVSCMGKKKRIYM